MIKEKNGVYVEIRKHNLDSSNAKLKQYVFDDMKQRSTKRQNFEPLNITKTTISGNLPAYKTEYTFLKTLDQKDFTNKGTINKILRFWTFANGNAYTVAYVSEKDDYDSYLPIALKIIDSLKINAQEKSTTGNGNATYPDCFGETAFSAPPCILGDGSTAYSCDDPRHLKSNNEQCVYRKSTGEYDLRLTLTGRGKDTSTTQSSKNYKVTIVNGSSSPSNGHFFDPKSVTIPGGSTVIWRNDDSTMHTVTSGNAEGGESGTIFDSSYLTEGKTFQHTFRNAGTFDYYCTLHPYMSGKIIVK